MAEGYKFSVENSSRPLTDDELFSFYIGVEATPINKEIENGPLVIPVDTVVTAAVHNENSKYQNKDYKVVYFIEPDGNMHATSSASVYGKMTDILDLFHEHNKDFSGTRIKFERRTTKDGSNDYIKCTLAR